MQASSRCGKVNPVFMAVIPPIIFLAGLMIFNAFRAVVPTAFAVQSTQQVEAMEVIKGISPTTKNGLPVPQAASLRGGGSSRLVIAHPASDGAFLMVSGSVSSGFLADKAGLDKMLHLKFDRSRIQVESGGNPVDAVLFFPRKETNPVVVDDPNTNPEVSVMSLLYSNITLKPIPPGTIEGTTYTSDNGMKIEVEMSMGRSGAISFGDVAQLNIKIDSQSTAWIEASRSIRQQHKAIGTEDLEIGLLLPLKNSGTESFVIKMFDEEVATIPRG